MIQGNRKNIFQANFVFFSGIFHSFCAFVLQHVWEYLCGNHYYAKSKKEADFVWKKVRRPKIFFWCSAPALGLTLLWSRVVWWTILKPSKFIKILFHTLLYRHFCKKYYILYIEFYKAYRWPHITNEYSCTKVKKKLYHNRGQPNILPSAAKSQWTRYQWTRLVPANTRRNNVIMTSKRRRDVVLTKWWCCCCVVCPLG